MLEHLSLYVLQSIDDRTRSLSDASLQAYLGIDLEAQLFADLMDLCIWSPFLDVLGTLDNQLTQQEVKDRLSILFINHLKII